MGSDLHSILLSFLTNIIWEQPQNNDIVRIVSSRANIHWTPPEQKKEVLAELIALNPDCQLADLKMLVGDYSS